MYCTAPNIKLLLAVWCRPETNHRVHWGTTGLHPGAQSVYIIEIHVACLGPSCSAAQVYALFVEISVLCKVRQSMYHTIRVSNLYIPQGKV